MASNLKEPIHDSYFQYIKKFVVSKAYNKVSFSFPEIDIAFIAFVRKYMFNLSYDVASGSEIAPCNKICKPLVVYNFTGNVITSITTLRK